MRTHDMFKRIVFIFSILVGSTVCDPDQFDEEEFGEKLRSSLEIFVQNGTADDFLIDVGHTVMDEGISPRFGTISETVLSIMRCKGCSVSFNVLAFQYKWQGRDSVVKSSINICNLLPNKYGPEFCQAIIELNADIFIYIVNEKPNLKGEELCAILLQTDNCPSDSIKPWQITIPPHNPNLSYRYPYSTYSSSIKVLHFTDAHYDPYYLVGSSTDCPFPMCCNIFDPNMRPSEAAGYWGDYRSCDSPYHLLINSLENMNKNHPDVDVVYYTGDVVNHKIWDTSVEANSEEIKFFYRNLKYQFKGKPVYPILGNHEPHPLNVFAPLDVKNKSMSVQWLYDLVAEEWRTWLPFETQETIKRGGFYTLLIKPKLRLIALNSNVGYIYNFWLVLDHRDPYGQLQWLADVLYQAEQQQEFVHILSHVYPGDVEVFRIWGSEFRRIIQRFHPIIKGIFYGHTHYDEFAVYFDVNDLYQGLVTAYNGGSVTPYENLNSNYKIYYFDSNNFEMLDYQQWIFNLTDANLHPREEPIWYNFYNFKDTFGVYDMTASTMGQLMDKIAMFQIYSKLYYRVKVKNADPSLLQTCDDSCHMDNICTSVRNEFTDNRKCDNLKELYENNN